MGERQATYNTMGRKGPKIARILLFFKSNQNLLDLTPVQKQTLWSTHKIHITLESVELNMKSDSFKLCLQ